MNNKSRPTALFYLLALALLALDQWTKYWARTALFHHAPLGFWRKTVVVIPHFFNLAFAANSGIAFSFFTGKNHLLLGLMVAVFLVIALAVWKWGVVDWSCAETNVLAALIAGGALGNLIDRGTHGYVVDFLDFYWRTSHYPTFNVADSAITCAAVWIAGRAVFAKG